MKKWSLLIAVLVLFGLAYAGGGPATDSGQAWAINEDGSSSVSLSETINLTIPKRYALHLTETEWNLDLGDVPAAAGDYTFNPEEMSIPGEGCYLVPKTVTNGSELKDYLLEGGVLHPIDVYPAIKDRDGDGKISDDEKGTIICVNHKILQKFSNDPDGWKLSVGVTGPQTGFGWFGMADRILPAGGLGYFFTNSLPVTGQVVASGQGTTHGWLDDDIIEAFWFDGTEAAGDYTMTVTFTLTGL